MRGGFYYSSSTRLDGRIMPVFSAPVDLPEVVLWKSRVIGNGGGLTDNSEIVAKSLARRILISSYNGKIKYLLPLLGTGIQAARVPLIDMLNVGSAINTGFVDGDFSESVGLDNPTEASKSFDTQIKPNQLGVSSNAGLGWWEGNWGAGSGVEPIGSYDNGGTNRYVIDGRSTFVRFRWGAPGNAAGEDVSFGNNHYYGQRSSATSREAFKNGSSLAIVNTTSDAASGSGERNIYMMATNAGSVTYWKGRCKVAYMTDGTMTSGEISAFHSDLQNYLITPTGR